MTEVPSGELALLLAQSDILHTGGVSLKAEGFRLLLDNRAEVRKSRRLVLTVLRPLTQCYYSKNRTEQNINGVG